MKLVNYKCSDCHYEEEFLYQDTDKVLTSLVHFCPMCGGILRKFNFKDNKQVWRFLDERK